MIIKLQNNKKNSKYKVEIVINGFNEINSANNLNLKFQKKKYFWQALKLEN